MYYFSNIFIAFSRIFEAQRNKEWKMLSKTDFMRARGTKLIKIASIKNSIIIIEITPY